MNVNVQPVHGSMYRHLWSNGPKECLEFADYTFEEVRAARKARLRAPIDIAAAASTAVSSIINTPSLRRASLFAAFRAPDPQLPPPRGAAGLHHRQSQQVGHQALGEVQHGGHRVHLRRCY